MKNLFSAEDVAMAIEKSKVVKVSTKAVSSPLGSNVFRKGNLTDTAKLDFLLLTGISLTAGHKVHMSQLVALSASAGYTFKPARIKDHIVKTGFATFAEGMIFVEGKMLDHYLASLESAGFISMLLALAPKLASVIGLVQADWDTMTKKDKAAVIEEAHIASLVMNAPKVITRKKANSK